MKVCLFLLAVGVFVKVASVVDARSEEVKIGSVFEFRTSDAGHNIVADGWARASNPHPHPLPSYTHSRTQTITTAASKMHLYKGACPQLADKSVGA